MSQCAVDCFDQAATNNGCDPSDTLCVCTSQNTVTAAVNCSLTSCTVDDMTTIANLFKTKCEGLAASAVAGIAVGASVVTAICLVSASFLYAKRRKRCSPAAYANPRSGTVSSYPYHREDEDVLWIVEEGLTQRDGTSSMAQSSYAASNTLDIAPPPPYPRQQVTDSDTPSEKPLFGFRGPVIESPGEGLGRANEAEVAAIVAPIFSSRGSEHRLDPEYGSRYGWLGPAQHVGKVDFTASIFSARLPSSNVTKDGFYGWKHHHCLHHFLGVLCRG
ncbi:hypothetical protein V8D89_001389 [Ganoderma adspersum]